MHRRDDSGYEQECRCRRFLQRHISNDFQSVCNRVSDRMSEMAWRKTEAFDRDQLSKVIGLCRQCGALKEHSEIICLFISRLGKKGIVTYHHIESRSVACDNSAVERPYNRRHHQYAKVIPVLGGDIGSNKVGGLGNTRSLQDRCQLRLETRCVVDQVLGEVCFQAGRWSARVDASCR